MAMSGFQTIGAANITSVLSTTTRQYLVGNLKRPQQLEFIRDSQVEIGITAYDDFATELAHKHSIATEYQYMLSGWTQYLNLGTNEIFEFKQGDFFAIFPNTSYAQKSKKGTKILFIKVPSINDKELADMSDDVIEWLNAKLKTIRKDHFHDQDAPVANSIHPAAAAAIVNERQEILMLERADNGKWTMPGGTMELGESLSQCAVREVEEETGLAIKLSDVIGTYTDPGIRIEYSDGEVRQEFTVVYRGECVAGSISLDEESTAWKWIPLSEVQNLPMAESQRRRINDVITYFETGEKQFK